MHEQYVVVLAQLYAVVLSYMPLWSTNMRVIKCQNHVQQRYQTLCSERLPKGLERATNPADQPASLQGYMTKPTPALLSAFTLQLVTTAENLHMNMHVKAQNNAAVGRMDDCVETSGYA